MVTGNIEHSLEKLKQQAEGGLLRLTLHAQQEMVEEDILYEDLLNALRAGTIIENYPDHQRGSCCLVCGKIDFFMCAVQPAWKLR